MAFAEPAPRLAPPEAPTFLPPRARTTPRPAGFWVRVGANVLDGIAAALIGIGPLAVAAGVAAPGIIVALAALLLLFMYLGYAPVMLAFNNGATWGKQACEQRVVVQDGRAIGLGRALLRELVVKSLMGVLILPYWASALMVAIRQDKRGLHDLIVGTRVVRDVREF
jgi:uncharacterized RDD family membrane protein YckC